MIRLLTVLCLFFLYQNCSAQTDEKERLKDLYFEEQKAFSGPMADYIYSDFSSFNSTNEITFLKRIDSLENIFNIHLENYSDRLEQSTIEDENIGISYFFNQLLLEYTSHHENYTGNKISLSAGSQSRLDKLKKDFNNESLLSNRDFRSYVDSFLTIQANIELSAKDSDYSKEDNQKLNATWKSIDTNITEQKVKDYWRQQFLYNHIDDIGIKNIEAIYNDFISSCQNTEFVSKTKALYEQHLRARSSHIIETYKEVGGFNLDMHLFLPDSSTFRGVRPVIVYFHGGSWNQGKPDWFFESGENYAKQGWVAVAVEYRINARHGTSPFESVMDARSGVRWLRANANRYNIDSSKIVATGNSAGAHIAMTATLSDNWNEISDDTSISSSPDAILVTSGVFDLTVDNTKWISKNLKDKDVVKEISPNHLLKSNLPPMLIIHGENDKNCLYSTAEYFTNSSKALGNSVDLYTVSNAEHFIWYGRYSQEVSEVKREFLERLGFN